MSRVQPVALVALSVVPLTAGTLRLVQLAGGAAVLPADPRFAGAPAPLVAHVLGAAVYALLGVLQLQPSFRRRHLAWHRRAGRLLVGAGLVVAGSALWMTLGYEPKPGTGPLLQPARLLAASGMALCLVLGVRTVRAGDVAAHRAWMVRAYALGLGAGTQVLTEGLVEAVLGTGELRGDLAKSSAWLINLAVAEGALRRRRAPVAVAALR